MWPKTLHISTSSGGLQCQSKARQTRHIECCSLIQAWESARLNPECLPCDTLESYDTFLCFRCYHTSCAHGNRITLTTKSLPSLAENKTCTPATGVSVWNKRIKDGSSLTCQYPSGRTYCDIRPLQTITEKNRHAWITCAQGSECLSQSAYRLPYSLAGIMHTVYVL